MILAYLVAGHPALFYPQTWYAGEAFMSLELPLVPCGLPTGVVATPVADFARAHAVELATQFVKHPRAAVWQRYLWTKDVDGRGQRVYVGGCSAANGWRLEIHRHIHLTEQFGVPTWSH